MTLMEELEKRMADPRFKYAVRRAADGHDSRTEMSKACGVYYKKFAALCELYREQREAKRATCGK